MAVIDRFQQYVENLQLLHDVLARSPIADRYGVFGGLLLGIVREGQPLPGDWDADFYYLEGEVDRFEASIPSLHNVGFERLYRYVANDGIAWEYSFHKDGAKFEFFRTKSGEGGRLFYYDFVMGNTPVQQWKAFTGLPLAPMEFLDRRWLVAEDVEASLTSVYGDWRTPDPGWTWANDPKAIRRDPWNHSDKFHWKA